MSGFSFLQSTAMPPATYSATHWILQVTSQKNTDYDHEMVAEVNKTLGRHLEATNFQGSNYWFLITGSKDKLEKLMNGKSWFKRENLTPDSIVKAAK